MSPFFEKCYPLLNGVENLECKLAFHNLCQNQQKESREQFKIAAESGSLAARLFLIFLYGEGVGTDVDIEEAQKYMLSISSEMKTKNDQEKIQLYRGDFQWMKGLLEEKISSQKILGAVYSNIAYMCLRGWGTEKDLQSAFDYGAEAVRYGNIFSCYEVGKMYQDGVVVKQDFQKAYSLYKVAADKGNAFANYQLGIMYRDGLGVEKNEMKYKEYFKKAEFVVKKYDREKR
jgi:TPR repeat protein